MKKTSPTPFMKKVWELALSIPPGRVTTYGLLTISAGGHPMMAQMITSILGRSPDVDRIPFHRIVYAGGKVWMSPKYRKVRLKLYKEEGIILDKKDKIANFEKIVYGFGL
ncbi:MGMT family protein [Candidatus Shapirobacteria bacterium]|nr:MGMT family protein [Candidatus Shapirobacteria bacterium]